MNKTLLKEVKKEVNNFRAMGAAVLERHKFPKEVKFDSSAIYAIWHKEIDGWAFANYTTPNAEKFIHKLSSVLDAKFSVIQPSDSGFQTYTLPVTWDVEGTMSNHYIPTDYIVCDGDGYKLDLFPYHDGIMIQAIIIDEDKRGQGIGSKVMNKLYDLSDELEVPLYLIPYPAEKFEPSQVFQRVERLEKWYSSLDFGPVDGHPTIWSNY